MLFIRGRERERQNFEMYQDNNPPSSENDDKWFGKLAAILVLMIDELITFTPLNFLRGHGYYGTGTIRQKSDK